MGRFITEFFSPQKFLKVRCVPICNPPLFGRNCPISMRKGTPLFSCEILKVGIHFIENRYLPQRSTKFTKPVVDIAKKRTPVLQSPRATTPELHKGQSSSLEPHNAPSFDPQAQSAFSAQLSSAEFWGALLAR